jgi:hypothetical protein
MIRQSSNKSTFKIVLYAVALAAVVSIGFIVMQDIKVPTEHITQTTTITLEK